MPTLAQRVHDLPRELFDMIFELTFTLDKEEVRINRRKSRHIDEVRHRADHL